MADDEDDEEQYTDVQLEVRPQCSITLEGVEKLID